MSKKISTISGHVYCVTMAAGGEITGTGPEGTELVLAKAESGQQVTFQAISPETTCSDEGAVVIPFDDAPAMIGVGGGEGGSGGGASGGGVDPAQLREVVAEVVEGEVYEESEVEVSTNDGTVNAEARYVQLAGRYVPDGVVRKIAVKCRLTASANIATEAMYLGVWEKEEGSDKYVRMGSSTAAVAQVVGERKVWAFEGLRLHGRTVRLAFLREHDGLWPTSWDSQIMGVACAAREGGDTESLYMGRGGAASNYAAAVVFTKVVLTDKYADVGHVVDTTVHLQEGEREKWNKAASDAGSALTKATAAATNTSLTSHKEDAVVHLQDGERAKWNKAASDAEKTGASLTSHTSDKVAHLTSEEHEGLTGLLSGGGGGGGVTATKQVNEEHEVDVITGVGGMLYGSPISICGAALMLSNEQVKNLNELDVVFELAATFYSLVEQRSQVPYARFFCKILKTEFKGFFSAVFPEDTKYFSKEGIELEVGGELGDCKSDGVYFDNSLLAIKLFIPEEEPDDNYYYFIGVVIGNTGGMTLYTKQKPFSNDFAYLECFPFLESKDSTCFAIERNETIKKGYALKAHYSKTVKIEGEGSLVYLTGEQKKVLDQLISEKL